MSYFGCAITKDRDVEELTFKTSLRILDIINQKHGHEPTSQTTTKNQIEFVSFEQALSELIQHEQSKKSSIKQ